MTKSLKSSSSSLSRASYWVNASFFNEKSPVDSFILQQIEEITTYLKDYKFDKKQVEQILTLLHRGYLVHRGDTRKEEYLDDAKTTKKPAYAHMLSTILRLLRDLKIIHVLKKEDFKHPNLYQNYRADISVIHQSKFLFDFIVTALLHDDIEKKKIYPVVTVDDLKKIESTSSVLILDPDSYYVKLRNAIQNDETLEKIFISLPNSSSNAKMFLLDLEKDDIVNGADHQSVDREQAISTMSMGFFLTHLFGQERAEKYLEYIIYLSYPYNKQKIGLMNPDLYYKRISEILNDRERLLIMLVKAYEQRDNSYTFDRISKKEVGNADAKRTSETKFRYGVDSWTKALPRVGILWPYSDKKFKEQRTINPHIYERAKYRQTHQNFGKIKYDKIPHYQSTQSTDTKKQRWSELQFTALEAIKNVILQLPQQTQSLQTREEKKAEFEKRGFFNPVPLLLTTFDLPFLFVKKEEGSRNSMFSLISQIVFEGLKKVDESAVLQIDEKIKLTSRGEQLLAKILSDALAFGKVSLSIEIPEKLITELFNKTDIQLTYNNGTYVFPPVTFQQLIKLIQYPAYRQNKDTIRGLVCDLLRQAIMELLILINKELLEEDERFMEFIVNSWLKYFVGYNKIDESQIAIMQTKWQHYLHLKSKYTTLPVVSDESRKTKEVMIQITKDFFYLFDDVRFFVDLDKLQHLDRKPYYQEIQEEAFHVFSRLKTEESTKKSRYRRQENDPKKSTRDYLGINLSLHTLPKALCYMNLMYDLFPSQEEKIIKLKNLLTIDDLEAHKKLLTASFYHSMKKVLNADISPYKTITASEYKDGKLQFTPPGCAAIELKMVLTDHRNTIGFTHDDFYGLIGKNMDILIRTRCILTDKDFENIILAAFEKSSYIQKQFGFDREKAIVGCKNYYQDKFIPVYHGSNKTTIYGRTSEEGRVKFIQLYGTAGEYSIYDEYRKEHISTYPTLYLINAYEKNLKALTKDLSAPIKYKVEQIFNELDRGLYNADTTRRYHQHYESFVAEKHKAICALLKSMT